MEKRLHDFDVRAMAGSVAESLWAMYHRRDDAPSLILPTTRDGAIRVSEQESKLLLSHWLERERVPHSIETPTVERYQQKGQSLLSARIDVTVYGSRNPDDRILNVELKKGTADDEAFRKDFEKLLRERTDGLWFHTLDNAKSRTWSTLEEKMRHAFESEREHVDAAGHSISFAFCVLNPPRLVWFELDLRGDFDSQWPEAMRYALEHPSEPSWWTTAHPSPVRSSVPHPEALLSSRKGHEKWLIYCPEICADSFIHLNIQGSSYCLRFGCFGVEGAKDPEAPTTQQLLTGHRFVHQIDVKRERININKNPQYWVDRISECNRQYGIGLGTSDWRERGRTSWSPEE